MIKSPDGLHPIPLLFLIKKNVGEMQLLRIIKPAAAQTNHILVRYLISPFKPLKHV